MIPKGILNNELAKECDSKEGFQGHCESGEYRRGSPVSCTVPPFQQLCPGDKTTGLLKLISLLHFVKVLQLIYLLFNSFISARVICLGFGT